MICGECPLRQNCSSYCSTVSPTSRRRFVGIANDKSSSSCISPMRNWEHRHFEHMRKGVEKSWKSREEVVKIQLGLCGLMPPQVCDLFIQGLHSFHRLQNTRILNR